MMDRPIKSVPFILSIAACASVREGIATNPKPLDSLLNLSLMMLTDSTCPKASNACFNWSSVVSIARFPT
jgi:hypothetical protein